MSPFGERFLRSPQERLRAESAIPAPGRWALPVGTAEYVLLGLPAAARALLDQQYGDLVSFAPEGESASPTDADVIELEIRLAPARHFEVVDVDRQLMDFDQQFYESEVLLCGPNLLARFAVAPASRATLWISDNERHLWADLVGNCLRLMVAYRCLEAGGALLHSAAFLAGDGAHLLVGNRDSGKTRLARRALALGRTVLSDDLNAVVPVGNGLEVLKMPFAGDLGRTTGEPDRSFPIAGVHLLTAGPAGTGAVSRARSAASLVAASCFLNRDTYRHDRLSANLEHLARTHPPRLLDPGDESALSALLPAGG